MATEQVEIWKPAYGLRGVIEVSSLGRIRSLPKLDRLGRRVGPRVLINARLSGRYVRVRTTIGIHKIDRSVHVWVLESFIGPRPPGMHACHNDGNVWNNALENLRWDTPRANQRDKIIHGTIARGDRNGAAVLTDHAVEFIKAALDHGVRSSDLAKTYGVCRRTAEQIKRRSTWAHIEPACFPGLNKLFAALVACGSNQRYARCCLSAGKCLPHQVHAAERDLERAMAMAVDWWESIQPLKGQVRTA